MKNWIVILSLFLGAKSFALSSPFKSTIPGVDVPNAHVIFTINNAEVLRGQTPQNAEQYKQLVDFGVKNFVIFKDGNPKEIQNEVSNLQELGIPDQAIKQIPMPWKDITDFKGACRMTIQALNAIQQSVIENQSTYFHCNVGEDRTGYLAGLWDLWSGQSDDVAQIFQSEMCARGYEAGDKTKPRPVVDAIRETLTPTFLKMTVILKQARAQNKALTVEMCDDEPNVGISSQQFICH